MNSILGKLLGKRGIKSVDDLDKEEKAMFDNYNRVLSKRELTIDDLKTFLQQQIGLIEAKWKDFEYDKKAALIPYHTVYRVLLEAIATPETERVALEKYLIQLTQ